jgi:hypothetical protein
VYVTGLEGGETITLYDAAGRMYNSATATSDTYTTAVPTNGVYVVKVNEKVKKFVVR